MMNREAAEAFQRDYLAVIGRGLQLSPLFEWLPEVAFFAKDAASRFVRANRRLLQVFNCQHEWQILGRTDFDFRPPEVATIYIEEDRRVMRSGKSSSLHVQMVPDVKGPVRWYFVTKMPLRNQLGKICGVAGAMFETRDIQGSLLPFSRIEPALRHIHRHFRDPLGTPELARLVHLSERQFVRLFQGLFGEGPIRYIIRQRINAACHHLITTQQPISMIASHSGFYDQSAFTRAFQAHIGMTPTAYRQHHAGAFRFS